MERLRPQFFTVFHQILHAAQKCGRFDAYFCETNGSSWPILEVCGFRFRAVFRLWFSSESDEMNDNDDDSAGFGLSVISFHRNE